MFSFPTLPFGHSATPSSSSLVISSFLSLIRQLQAFTMIDQNRDGIIDIEDLKDIYSNLGEFEIQLLFFKFLYSVFILAIMIKLDQSYVNFNLQNLTLVISTNCKSLKKEDEMNFADIKFQSFREA